MAKCLVENGTVLLRTSIQLWNEWAKALAEANLVCILHGTWVLYVRLSCDRLSRRYPLLWLNIRANVHISKLVGVVSHLLVIFMSLLTRTSKGCIGTLLMLALGLRTCIHQGRPWSQVSSRRRNQIFWWMLIINLGASRFFVVVMINYTEYVMFHSKLL